MRQIDYKPAWPLAVMTVLVCLAGCTGMSSAGKSLKGQDIQVAVDKLGYPDSKQEMLGRTVYRWNTGNASDGGWYCNLTLAVDGQNKIVSGSWSGNNGGCSTLASRLN